MARLHIASLLLVTALYAQPAKPAPPALSTQQALDLAEKGRCAEALPVLRRVVQQAADKLRYRAGLVGARCAMALQRLPDALEILATLRRAYPNDPEVLYQSAHFFSQLADQSAQQLAASAPDSVPMRKLNAEALESQGKADDAITEYRKLLTEDPKLPELHFRIARLLLEKNPPQNDEAKQELNEELKVAPNNAAAEFGLGEIARLAGDWEPAIQHFTAAAKMDAGFVEAFLALGMSLNAARRFAEAVAPLERYVKLDPGDPAGHYQLATAYARTGKQAAADRELAEQRRLVEANPIRRP